MSTRGCVAIGDKKKWEGVYNHFDSYPSGLGKELYEHLRGKGVDGLKKFAAELLKYDDWRNYLAQGLCEYCGQKGFGQAHSISGVISIQIDGIPRTETEIEVINNRKETGFPDPLAKWHSHGNVDEHMNQDNSDALFIEWVYVIDPEFQKMYVFTHGRAKGEHEEVSYDGQRKWKSSNYKHYFVCEIDLSVVGVEPIWNEVSEKGDDVSSDMHKKFGKED